MISLDTSSSQHIDVFTNPKIFEPLCLVIFMKVSLHNHDINH